MENKPNRRRLPMLHWSTACDQKPDFKNQVAGFIFFTMHSVLEHECICETHNISVAEEWSYLPSDSPMVMRCESAAHSIIKHTQEAVATGWIESAIGTWCNVQYNFVQPTVDAQRVKSYRSFQPLEQESLMVKNLLVEVKSQQSDTWDFVIKDYEKSPGKKISCLGPDTRVLFPIMYGGQIYDIITKAGNKYTARVDDSREFASEGLEWKTVSDGNIEQYDIAAWKLIQ